SQAGRVSGRDENGSVGYRRGMILLATLRGSEPSDCATITRYSFGAVAKYAICLPSGDHPGALATSSTIFLAGPPTNGTRPKSSGCRLAAERVRTKSTKLESGVIVRPQTTPSGSGATMRTVLPLASCRIHTLVCWWSNCT